MTQKEALEYANSKVFSSDGDCVILAEHLDEAIKIATKNQTNHEEAFENGKATGREEIKIQIRKLLEECENDLKELNADRNPTGILIVIDRIATLKKLLGKKLTQ